MRPRRLLGASGRPLNFTVRSHFRGLTHREEQGTPSLGIAVYQVHLTMLSYGRLRLTPRYARAAFSLSIERGARAERGVLNLRWAEAPGPLRSKLGALNLATMSHPVATVGPHGHSSSL